VNPAALEPRRHEAPPGWSAETFEQVTNAIAAALVATVQRASSEHEAAPHACQRRGPDHHTGGNDGQSGG
jgi:hypothetical protein